MTDSLLAVVLLLSAGTFFLLWQVWSRRGADHAADFAALKEKADAQAVAARTLEAALREELARNREEQSRAVAGLREELTRALRENGESVSGRLDAFGAVLRETLSGQSKAVSERLETLALSQKGALESLAETNARRFENLRETLDRNLAALRASNDEKLEKMRATVDEKLAATLEGRLGETFRQVGERLDNVQKSFGEMQRMAGDVGDLKRVMTNVKTRGVFGEYVLESLVEQVLTPAQYEKNWRPKKRGAASQDAVEIAIRLPGQSDDESVWLPVDAKFPKEDFETLIACADRGDATGLENARKALAARVESFAMDIREKYVSPPATTDFAVMFLPAEGLYAEVVNRPGLVEKLQRMKITVAGPTTLLALLNSLHMGFRTLAIQKKSAEVWKTLQAVKTQVGTFGELLVAVQEKLDAASKTVGKAAERHRIMASRLTKVESLPAAETALPAEAGESEAKSGE